MTHYCKLKLKIENSDPLEFYYSYTQITTIDDLIEFIAYYYPDRHICPCYKLKANYENKELMEIDGNWLFMAVLINILILSYIIQMRTMHANAIIK